MALSLEMTGIGKEKTEERQACLKAYRALIRILRECLCNQRVKQDELYANSVFAVEAFGAVINETHCFM